MNDVYTFNFVKRLGGVRYPLILAFAFLALIAVFQPPVSSWKFWVLAALTVLMVARTAQFVLEGTKTVTLTETGVTRMGRTVNFHGAELELRTMLTKLEPKVYQVVLWAPRGEGGGRIGVGFDSSLNDFDKAVRHLVGRVPEMRVVVSAPGDADVRDDRREKVLAPFRGELTPAQRALASLGRPSLAPPQRK
jgi:hypothetical protein